MTRRVRPLFVWTPRQAAEPVQVLFAGKPRANAKNRWFLFRRTFELDAAPACAPLSITCDGRYLLFVNGERVGRGPVRCSPMFQRYDSYDISGQLAAGRNTVAVLVHTYGTDTAFYETTKGMWQPVFGDGGLWCEGSVGEDVSLDSDASWRCTEVLAWTQQVPQSNHSLGFIEDFDASLFPDGWTDPAFDDQAWDAARPMLAGGGGPEAVLGGMEIRPFPTLSPRGIPMLEEQLNPARRIVWMRGLVPEPDLPFHRRCYHEPFAPLTNRAITAPDDLLKLTGGATIIRTEPDRDVTVLLDFGRIVTGRPWIEIEGRGGEIVEIACCEHLPGEFDPGGPPPDARPTPNPWLGEDAHLARLRARAGRQTFERFEWCAIRWMQLTVRNAPEGLVIRGLGANLWNYPVEERGRFTSSDPFLDKLWATGAYTLRQCMHDAWEDCPSREQRQWLGDVTVENLAGWAAFGPSIAPLTAKYLEQAAESQRPDGLTQMFAPGDHKTDAILIPDWTLQWILTAGDHWRLTGDVETIRKIFPSILKALAWFERLLDPAGLVADMPYWHFMDWAAVGRHGEAAALNAQLAGAFRTTAELAAAIGWPTEAARCQARARTIAHALEARHWDERRGAYVDVVDPVTGEQEPRISQHANAAVALWGEPAPARIERALSRISESARLTFTASPPVVPTGAALDTEDGVVLANTFYSHFLYEALATRGRFGEALSLMRERFGPMLARGATTLWESFEPTASLCHGFSASPTYQLSRHILGVHPTAAGFAEIAVAPSLCGLDYAEGVVPTPRGDVSIKLERTGEAFVARVRAEAGTPIRLVAPAGFEITEPARKTPEGLEGRLTPKAAGLGERRWQAPPTAPSRAG